MNMRINKIFAALFLLGAATPLCFSQLHVTPEAGVFMLKGINSKALVSPRIGLGIDYLFSKEEKGWGIASGLYFYQKKDVSSGHYGIDHNNYFVSFYEPMIPPLDKIIYTSTDTRRSYLQLPVLAKYQWKLKKGYNLSVAAGPYIALGIAGNHKIYETTYQVEENKISQSNGKYNPYDFLGFERFEVGFSSSVALSVKQLSVKANYETNLNKRNLVRDNMFSLSIGYSFSL